ncbi:Zn(2)-C6 fungal-type domain-containing protein [Fusarium keratoplasticum]|uniref:Zn(2)-C6 fungal-type domain-containing protein n=1 Tax=Fusarium keratoplasticum TaxID=1328300 RepID=A0ACC0R5E4_9HYPO|nr:Zn(2)-C6 fungal-type domain-containing protein [Fusarium keratoplasticum]KAI8674446.1 Zn(2)-C6 fungal-type domain-containing protein [Fusarium keratoplasticum]
MPPAAKTAASCWICRIRHKKCDESLPRCQNCEALELSCLYSDDKPAWMDNGDKQREMAQRLKAQVKRNAKERRGRRMIQKITREIEGHSRSTPSNPPSLSPSRDEHFTASIQESITVDQTTDHQLSDTDVTTPTQNLPFNTSPTVEGSRGPIQRDGPTHDFFGSGSGPLVIQNEQDLRFITAYTDYIFPLLNPFYRPTFLEGGRSWLLVFAMRNTESCQLVISLATYFLSVVPIFPGPGHSVCSSHTWQQVQSQSDLAVKGMQQRVEAISRCGVSGNLLQSTHLLGDIMLLLKFETMTDSSSSWRVHLYAATVLFEQFLSSPDLDDDIWKIPSDVEAVVSKSKSALSTKEAHRFEASQTAFRFFSAAVITADIIASTALGQLPRLREHHERVLGTREKPHLNLKHIVGCENWIFLSIADIVELDLWKKNAKKSGAFSLMDLIQRASKITQDLDDGLISSSSSDSDRNARKKDGIFSVFNPQRGQFIDHHIVTRIWANSARLYLLVVLSGWQPGSSEIREIVTKNLDLLKNLPSPSWLLALAWPFCVTGCLVTKEQECAVCDIYEATEPLKNIGPISEAMGIIRRVWEQREGLIGETWDMASCFGSMGRTVLLI